MSRPGRPRRHGAREGNGRVQRVQKAERDAKQVEMCYASRTAMVIRTNFANLRWGDLSTAINCQGRAMMPVEFGNLTRHFLTAKTSTKPVVSLGFGSGRGVSPEKAKWLAGELTRIEMPLKRLSPSGFSGMRDLKVFEREAPRGTEPEVAGTLFGLAKLLRKLGRGVY